MEQVTGNKLAQMMRMLLVEEELGARWLQGSYFRWLGCCCDDGGDGVACHRGLDEVTALFKF